MRYQIPPKILDRIRSLEDFELQYLLRCDTGLIGTGPGVQLSVVADVSVTRDLSQLYILWHVWLRFSDDNAATQVLRNHLRAVDGFAQLLPLTLSDSQRFLCRRVQDVTRTLDGWYLDEQEITSPVTDLLARGIVYPKNFGLAVDFV